MIEKTGLIYSQNADLSNSQTIEQSGEQSSITIPSWQIGVDLYCKAYCIDDGVRVESSIEHYLPFDVFYLKNEYSGQNTVTFTGGDSGAMYSKDKVNWTQITATSVTMEEGEKLYLKGYNNNIFGTHYSLDCSQIYSIGGRIDGSRNNTLSSGAYVFQNSTTLIDASAAYFGSTEQTSGSCAHMFDGCTNLTTTPNMSRIKKIMTDYFNSAFQNTKITTVDLSNLQEVGEGGLEYAFMNSKLNSIIMDNITTVGISSLLQCFKNTKLTRGIDLKNITTYNGSMCFNYMYDSCVYLEEATYPPTILDNNVMTNWLRSAGTSVTGTKTVYCPTGVTIPSNNSGVPSGWTRVDY